MKNTIDTTKAGWIDDLVNDLDDEGFQCLKDAVEESQASRDSIQQRIDDGSDNEDLLKPEPYNYSRLLDILDDCKSKTYYVKLKSGKVALVWGLTIDCVLLQVTYFKEEKLWLKPLTRSEHTDIVEFVEEPQFCKSN